MNIAYTRKGTISGGEVGVAYQRNKGMISCNNGKWWADTGLTWVSIGGNEHSIYEERDD